MAFKRSLTLLALLVASVVASPYSSPNSGPDSCGKNNFWYPTKETCLPHGGISRPPSPPRGKACPPTNWYWHSQKSCCVPTHPQPRNPPPPQCYHDYQWNQWTQCCEPTKPTKTTTHSQPSQTPHNPYYPPSYGHKGGNDGYRRNKRSHPEATEAVCPRSYSACPLDNLTAGYYECMDTTTELRSCGGCVSMGEGKDCTAIQGAWNVGCEAGVCAGYRVSQDGASCEAL
ncbi:protein priA [Hysterangium stoloniferum]|nr:protein priA [Hysterangium stoloniferum]